MPGLSDFGLQGLDGVLNHLDAIGKKLEAEARAALDELGDEFVADVVAETPVVTGAAADSVKKRKATADFVEVVAGGAEAPYFPIIEWGGVHNASPAAPFRRAMEIQRLTLVSNLAGKIKAKVPELKG